MPWATPYSRHSDYPWSLRFEHKLGLLRSARWDDSSTLPIHASMEEHSMEDNVDLSTTPHLPSSGSF